MIKITKTDGDNITFSIVNYPGDSHVSFKISLNENFRNQWLLPLGNSTAPVKINDLLMIIVLPTIP